MALPKIDVPTFDVNVKGTNENIKCRPFLVKENKLLTLAVASEDKNEMLKACKQIIKNCCYDDVDIDSLAMYQLQDVFLQIRMKSVGEIQTVELLCGNCNSKLSYDLDLNDFEVAGNTESDTLQIEFSKTSGMVIKYPSAEVFANSESMSDIEILINSIEYIYDDEEIVRPDESNYEEILEFVDSLPLDKYNEAEQFFAYMPTLVHTVQYDCKECNTHNRIAINGYEHFFA